MITPITTNKQQQRSNNKQQQWAKWFRVKGRSCNETTIDEEEFKKSGPAKNDGMEEHDSLFHHCLLHPL